MGRRKRREKPTEREILDPPVVPEEGEEIALDAGFEAWTRRLFAPPEDDAEPE